MIRLKSLLTAGTFGAVVAGFAPAPVVAYPIDCAILLCLAGGFPASAECTAAKAEVIRRITPIPVEPPLQLWNCPMGLSNEVAAAIGGAAVQLGADGLTPEVREYRDAIEIYQIYYHKWRTRDDEGITDSTLVGDYREADGEFFWKRGSFIHGPEWLASAVGGYRQPIYEFSGRDDHFSHSRIIGYENHYGRGSYRTYLRAIAMRFKDYKGDYHVEVVRY